jgi:hypothetical protein
LFERPHHRDVALVLQSLDPQALSQRHCYFGGGTAMALRYGEYRESVDIDFRVSDLAGYRELRQMLGNAPGLQSIAPIDLAAEKLLANADRWADDAVYSRDLIDLAMMQADRPLLEASCVKAEAAYGDSIRRSLAQAVDALHVCRRRGTGWFRGSLVDRP